MELYLSFIPITSYLNNLHGTLERYFPLYTISNTQRNRDTQCHPSGNFASRDMTFGQLKSLYFEECDGVQSNQKMHDLYATMHIFQMALPDAVWAV